MHSLENAKNFKSGLFLASNNKNFPIKFHAPAGFFPMVSFIHPCERVKKKSAHTFNVGKLHLPTTEREKKPAKASPELIK